MFKPEAVLSLFGIIHVDRSAVSFPPDDVSFADTVVAMIPYIVALNDRECGVWGRARFKRRYGNDD